jgi:hypothetical protein
MGTKISLLMLLLGASLLWAVPLGGALLLVTAAVALAICWEGQLEPPPAVAPAPVTVRPAGADDFTFPAD